MDDDSQIIEELEQKSKSITTLDDKWISEWATLIEKYFKLETRNHIRLKAIAILSQIFSKYHVICEDELMNRVILPNFNEVDQENDSVVRRPIVHLLFDVASTCLSYKHCNAILAIVRKILNKPYKQKSEESGGLVYIIGNVDIIDSRLTITNLNKLFKTKLYRLPIEPAVNMLDIAVNYLTLTYKCPLQDPAPAEIPLIRRELFSLFLSLRCNKYGHLGVVASPSELENEVVHSPFIICVKRPQPSEQTSTPMPDSPTQLSPPTNQSDPQHQNNQWRTNYYYTLAAKHKPVACNTGLLASIQVPNANHANCPVVSRGINLDAMFAGIIDCINHEVDLDVLKLVLSQLPHLLSNKPLVLTTTEEKINQLCLALGDLIRPAKAPRQASRIDVKLGLRCLTALLTYRKSLDHRSIKSMLAAFEDSLKVARLSIVSLFTTCLIELQDNSEMARFLPVVLNRLSKFSPTLSLAVSMLEFLSYLILFPKLYENFSEDEYKFIFAIALPYTNPCRYGEYITCLAFRVIAMWYLNSRPALRSVFVEFVKKSLQSNVIQPFKENPASIYSQTSSPITHTPPITHSCPAIVSPVDQRKRSSSLNTENSFKAQQAALGIPNQQLSLQVNEELIETFADLLSRYTHGQCLAIAPKNRCIELLVDRSTSQTWLHGNSLVTITSGLSSHGWAEIIIRRPTGNTIWIGRLQNTLGTPPVQANQQVYLDSLNFGNDIISMFGSVSLVDHPCSNIEHNPSNSTPQSTSSSTTTLAGSTATSISQTGSSHHCRFRNPTPLPKDKKSDLALSNFDHITPYETHKVGVIYVARNQVDSRAAILSNKCGPPRYYEFLSHIGTCIILNDIDPELYFIGGLDVKGDDGKYAYFWKDNLTQVIFHVATCMPTRENDPQGNNKNRHIGNDHVCIVYNDSKTKFKMSTIKGTGQFIMACIVITPLEEVTNVVEVEVLPDLLSIVGEIEPKVLSNVGASLYARQMAIHLNIASKIFERQQREGFMNKEPFVSNWVERLRCIKRIRQRLDESRRISSGNSVVSRAGNIAR